MKSFRFESTNRCLIDAENLSNYIRSAAFAATFGIYLISLLKNITPGPYARSSVGLPQVNLWGLPVQDFCRPVALSALSPQCQYAVINQSINQSASQPSNQSFIILKVA